MPCPQCGSNKLICCNMVEANSLSGIWLGPGDDLQVAIDAAPPATTFHLRDGVYPGTIRPRPGDRIQGESNDNV